MRSVIVLVTAVLLSQPVVPPTVDVSGRGPQPGATAPAFSLTDQDGRVRTLASLLGRNGALLVFSRSADWWPYCRTQLVELQRRVPELTAQGLGLAVVTYDPPAVLKRFATERGLTFPLLSDTGSAVIRRYDLLNPEYPEGSRAHGVPYPGTFVLDTKGVVKARYFETAYQERNTVASILTRQGGAGRGPAVSATTAHLTVQASASDQTIAPGSRISFAIQVTPARGMHVYAPGKHDYQVIRFVPAERSWLKSQPTVYPPSEIYHFVPLDERVETYQRPFTLVQDLTVLATPEVQKQLAGQTSLTVEGRLEYQACDDKVCYAPASVPLSFTFDLTPLDRPTPRPGR